MQQRELDELDREIARLGRGAGAVRLRLGEVLERLAVRGGHHALGFSSLTGYALERCERSGRWAFESRTVARRLSELPRLRAALANGELSWSMVELIARHASRDDEHALLARARTSTVRQMREVLKDREEDADEELPLRTLTVTVPTDEAWAFESTRILIEHLEGGKASTDTVLGAMLAEGEIMLQGIVAAEQRDGYDWLEHAEAAKAWRAELARHRAEAELRCEGRIPRAGRAEVGSETDADGADELSDDPVALDRRIRALASELTRRELALGDAALRLFQADGWRRLGYATATQYAREGAGMSYSSLKAHMTLARRARREPVLGEALCAGRIGNEAARLVGRVAVAKTVKAWVARAQERTIKHLHEEVKAVELIARVLERGDVEPPDDDLLSAVAALESAVLSGRVYGQGQVSAHAEGEAEGGGQMSANPEAEGGRDSQMSANPGADSQMSAQVEADGEGDSQMSANPEAVGEGEGDSPMSANGERDSPMSAHDRGSAPGPRRGAGTTTLRWRVTEETYREYRALERDYLRHTTRPLGFLGFLCLAVWDSWHAGLGRKGAYAEIYERDRYRCSSPVCTRSDVTPHHLRFRSQGGDDAPENVTALCVWCHLEGVHGGRIRALPPAPHVHWTLGERALLVVHDRQKRELECAARVGA